MTGPLIPQVRARGAAPGAGRATRAARVLGPAATVSAAFLLTNALSYAFTVLAARALAPAAYGELAALMGVLLVGSVPAAGLQTVAALYLGGRTADGRVTARLHATAVVLGLAVCAAGGLAAAPLAALLHLPDAGAVAWLVLLLLPHTVFAAYQGGLQGTGRHRRLAAVTVVFGAAKLAGGVSGLVLAGTPAGALAGMTGGTALGLLLGWVGCGRPGLTGRLRAPLLSAVRASAALLGFVVLVNLDLLLARHHLPAAVAGEYAVASIVAKVAFWLPQGVGVVLLPRLGDAGRRHRLLPRAIGLLTAVGGLLVLGTAALGTMALPLIGGAAYGASLGSWTWLFALLGTLLAIAQLLLYSGIAAADRFGTLAVWLAVGAEGGAVAVLGATGSVSLLTIAGTATATSTLLVGAGLLRLRAARRARPARGTAGAGPHAGDHPIVIHPTGSGRTIRGGTRAGAGRTVPDERSAVHGVRDPLHHRHRGAEEPRLPPGAVDR